MCTCEQLAIDSDCRIEIFHFWRPEGSVNDFTRGRFSIKRDALCTKQTETKLRPEHPLPHTRRAMQGRGGTKHGGLGCGHFAASQIALRPHFGSYRAISRWRWRYLLPVVCQPQVSGGEVGLLPLSSASSLRRPPLASTTSTSCTNASARLSRAGATLRSQSDRQPYRLPLALLRTGLNTSMGDLGADRCRSEHVSLKANRLRSCSITQDVYLQNKRVKGGLNLARKAIVRNGCVCCTVGGYGSWIVLSGKAWIMPPKSKTKLVRRRRQAPKPARCAEVKPQIPERSPAKCHIV